jgi:AraC-like DNA-binding protein
MALPPISDLDRFLPSPVGRCFAAGHVLLWYPDRQISIISAWDRPTEQDCRLLCRALSIDPPPLVAQHLSLLDFHALLSMDLPVFEIFCRFIAERRDHYRQRVARCAVVWPTGNWQMGALVAGLLPLLGDPFPWQLFTDSRDALCWLGRDDAEVLVGGLAGLAAQASEQTTLVQELRDVLTRQYRGLTIAQAAALLRTSSRTLQRQLRGAQTSFHAELDAARVHRAKALLLGSDMKLLAVAQAVGYHKTQPFTAVFRRATGQSPAAWRQEHRARSSGG